MANKNETNKTNTTKYKGKKKFKKIGKQIYLSLLNEACCYCSKLPHLRKRMGKEY
jgi:hypothetical protein